MSQVSMSPARLRWGLLFIAVGVLLLATKSNWLSGYYWLELLDWWPVLLIAIGIEKIFLKTSVRIISYLSPIALVLFMFYLAVDVGEEQPNTSYFSRMHWEEPADDSVKTIEADINHGSLDLRVGRSLDMLAEVRAGRYTRKPDLDFAKHDSTAVLDVDSRISAGSIVYFHGGRYRDDWSIALSETVPVKLKCEGREADENLLMSRIPLKEVSIKNDDGDIYLKIGSLEPEVLVRVDGDDARLSIRLPAESGLKANGGTYGSYFREIGLIDNNGYYYSPGYDSASVKIDLDIESQLRHLSIEYY